MARHHVVFYLKREESPPLSLGAEDNVVNVRRWLPDSDFLALIYERPLPPQTRSMTHSAPLCSSVTKSQPGCSKSLKEQLADARGRIRELKRENRRLQHKNEELVTYCYHSSGNIVRLQQQLRSKEARQRALIDAKKPNVDLRVPEWRLELEQRWEEAMSDWISQNEARAQKPGAEDQVRRNRSVDLSFVFTGPLNMTRRKQELEGIAIALSLSGKGKKRDILESIKMEFEANPELRSDPRFEALFNSRCRKRARVARISEVPVAGPSYHR
jgi:hypothetical protein